MGSVSEPGTASWMEEIPVQEKIQRDDASKLKVVIVGAGLGGLGAAIAISLAGHDVTVLEAASEIGEVGAGIQILPNSARVLRSWGVMDSLEPFATKPTHCNFIGWRGNHLSDMDYVAYAKASGAPFWDFYRMNLHRCLLNRAVELGASIVTSARATGFDVSDAAAPGDGDGDGAATVHTADGRAFAADLVVGADGIHSRLRECFLGRADPPAPTGDLAYRLLLDTDRMRADPDLRPFLDRPQVNYWVGPGKHAVNYVLRSRAVGGGEQQQEEQEQEQEKEQQQPLLFNMVLLVPDDLPAGGADTLEGNIEEMRAHFAGWDPRVPKLLGLCGSVLKWRLMARPGLDPAWSHPSGAFTMLGDAVHATLPYLASGAGMALEDAGVLGLCLGRVTAAAGGRKERARALAVYEACRRRRTEEVVRRGTYNQWVYHLDDGEEQRARDERFRAFGERDRQWLGSKAPVLPAVDETGEDPFPWRYHGVGRWLLTYDMWKDVEARWAES